MNPIDDIRDSYIGSMTLDEMITANTHGEYESVGEWNIEHEVLDRDGLKQAIREAIESVRDPGDGYKEQWRYGFNAGINASLRALGLLEDDDVQE
jgi:hypothetical protein